MRVKFSSEVISELAKLKRKDKKLSKKIEKQLALFQENPKHPSLRTHKLTGNLTNRWSISLSKGLRMVYLLLDKDIAYFVDLGTHDEVYRK
ncbi:MAG: type II toxin-antitoxin system mRNA interferase toxin, RelE/StbE family [Candidatus Daviesbacteria bacterium]|nr:MAG: type II toxin-antitoxin system mRNA interferase toxin, RelE/StbE family [Candidatus Daviesbacteria bacterium]